MSVEETNLVADQYVYGIVPAEVELPQGLNGVKGEPVEKVVSGDFAALVTSVAEPDALGTPDDLLAHSTVLDRIAAEGPVLPMAFGTVVPDAETITTTVMPSMQDTYAEGLRRVDGATQYTVRARYVRERVIGEMVAENGEIAALRESTSTQSEEASHYDRIRLGQLVVEEFQRKAAVDSVDIIGALSPLARETSVRETTQADDVVEIALLVDRGSADGFEQAVEKLAEERSGRISFRMLGPQAPYDFVGEV